MQIADHELYNTLINKSFSLSPIYVELQKLKRVALFLTKYLYHVGDKIKPEYFSLFLLFFIRL